MLFWNLYLYWFLYVIIHCKPAIICVHLILSFYFCQCMFPPTEFPPTYSIGFSSKSLILPFFTEEQLTRLSHKWFLFLFMNFLLQKMKYNNICSNYIFTVICNELFALIMCLFDICWGKKTKFCLWCVLSFKTSSD